MIVDLFQGNNYVLALDFDTTTGEKDLTGTQVLKYAIAERRAGAPIIEKSLGEGVTITDPTTGKVTITLSAEDINQLKERYYYHELWQVNALGDSKTLISDKILITSKIIKE